jgi:hypothetical protein
MEPLTHNTNATHVEWNESYYLCFADPKTNIKGMSRVGFKPNKTEGMSFLFLFLPDGTAAGYQTTESLSSYGNPLKVGDMIHKRNSDGSWCYSFNGPMIVVNDPKHFPIVQNEPELIKEIKNFELQLDFSPLSEVYEYSKFMTEESRELGRKSGDEHWEQLAIISGKIQFDSEAIELDQVMGQRDHTHGIRDWTGIGNWLYYVVWFNRNLAINPAAIITDDGKLSIGGFIFRDGENIPIKTIDIVEQSFEKDGIYPRSSLLEITDWYGDRHSLKGTVGSILPIPFKDPEGKKSVLIQAFGEYELNGITGGYGTFETLRRIV